MNLYGQETKKNGGVRQARHKAAPDPGLQEHFRKQRLNPQTYAIERTGCCTLNRPHQSQQQMNPSDKKDDRYCR